MMDTQTKRAQMGEDTDDEELPSLEDIRKWYTPKLADRVALADKSTNVGVAVLLDKSGSKRTSTTLPKGHAGSTRADNVAASTTKRPREDSPVTRKNKPRLPIKSRLPKKKTTVAPAATKSALALSEAGQTNPSNTAKGGSSSMPLSRYGFVPMSELKSSKMEVGGTDERGGQGGTGDDLELPKLVSDGTIWKKRLWEFAANRGKQDSSHPYPITSDIRGLLDFVFVRLSAEPDKPTLRKTYALAVVEELVKTMQDQDESAVWTAKDQGTAERVIFRECLEDEDALSSLREDFALGTRLLTQIVRSHILDGLGRPAVSRRNILYDIVAVVLAAAGGFGHGDVGNLAAPRWRDIRVKQNGSNGNGRQRYDVELRVWMEPNSLPRVVNLSSSGSNAHIPIDLGLLVTILAIEARQLGTADGVSFEEAEHRYSGRWMTWTRPDDFLLPGVLPYGGFVQDADEKRPLLAVVLERARVVCHRAGFTPHIAQLLRPPGFEAEEEACPRGPPTLLTSRVGELLKYTDRRKQALSVLYHNLPLTGKEAQKLGRHYADMTVTELEAEAAESIRERRGHPESAPLQTNESSPGMGFLENFRRLKQAPSEFHSGPCKQLGYLRYPDAPEGYRPTVSLTQLEMDVFQYLAVEEVYKLPTGFLEDVGTPQRFAALFLN